MRVAVLLFEGYETLDAHGPIQFLGGRPVKDLKSSDMRISRTRSLQSGCHAQASSDISGLYGTSPLIPQDVELSIVAESTETLRSRQGVTIVPDYSFETCPSLDVLLVPGRGVS